MEGALSAQARILLWAPTPFFMSQPRRPGAPHPTPPVLLGAALGAQPRILCSPHTSSFPSHTNPPVVLEGALGAQPSLLQPSILLQ